MAKDATVKRIATVAEEVIYEHRRCGAGVLWAILIKKGLMIEADPMTEEEDKQFDLLHLIIKEMIGTGRVGMNGRFMNVERFGSHYSHVLWATIWSVK